ncbi:MAG: methyltransferase [Nocardioides sp.]
MLFRETEPPEPARILDLGCGYGVIGLAIAAAVPGARVTGVDVNGRAVLLANENAARLGLGERYAAYTRRTFRPASTTRIWSNRRSGSASRPCTSCSCATGWGGWCRAAAVLVVGKNLGADSLRRWLADQGYPTRRLASAKGFRVLEARRWAAG